MLGTVWLVPLKDLDDDARDIKLGDVAGMELAAGQEDFVGDPFKMMLMGLGDHSRRPYVVEADSAAVGVLTLQLGAATLAGWHDNDSAWLLRGFLIDRKQQGKGFGAGAAVAAIREARKLTARLEGAQSGVVLSVHERNEPARAAYSKAGFLEKGRYFGSASGPQWTMYREFDGLG
ncbi:GNAT family N-acetyltransferase [bacterium RCC_150]